MANELKVVSGVAIASVKKISEVALASVKKMMGVVYAGGVVNELDQSEDVYSVENGGKNALWGIRFTPTHSGFIRKASCYARRLTNTDGTFYMRLYNYTGGNVGSLIGTIGTLNVSDATLDWAWYDFTNAGDTCPITAETEYVMVVGVADHPADNFYWGMKAGGYTGGFTSVDDGANWSDNSSPMFKQYYSNP